MTRPLWLRSVMRTPAVPAMLMVGPAAGNSQMWTVPAGIGTPLAVMAASAFWKACTWAAPADQPISALRSVRPDRASDVGRGAAVSRRYVSRAPGKGAGTGGVKRPITGPPAARGAATLRKFTVVRKAGGASAAGRGRA